MILVNEMLVNTVVSIMMMKIIFRKMMILKSITKMMPSKKFFGRKKKVRIFKKKNIMMNIRVISMKKILVKMIIPNRMYTKIIQKAIHKYFMNIILS